MIARLAIALALVGCRWPVDKIVVDANLVDAVPPIDGDPKITPCASTFGSGLTQGFGRLDGIVRAVIPPNYQACPMPNRTHLILQVTMAGETYRMVVATDSDQGPPDVLFHELDAPLAGPAWADGWHTGVALDYPTTLGIHADAFVVTPQPALVEAITAQLEIGAHISVFASSGDANSNSAHLIHRNATNRDGAIVIDPDGPTPHYLVMRYDEQLF